MSKLLVTRVMTRKKSLWVGCKCSHRIQISGAIISEENLPSQIDFHKKTKVAKLNGNFVVTAKLTNEKIIIFTI